MSQRMHFLVHGKVQGVFFRNFTQQKAKSYGLTGWVKNRDDGTVEGEAQGEAASLERLKKDLNNGPRAARVVKLETKNVPAKDGESSFES